MKGCLRGIAAGLDFRGVTAAALLKLVPFGFGFRLHLHFRGVTAAALLKQNQDAWHAIRANHISAASLPRPY